MTSPSPPVALNGFSCSVISNNTLYVYSPQAFQSLPLQSNGSWSQLTNGVSADGAACVLESGSGSGTDDVLWIVGGTTNGTSQFSGLQSYTFSSATWQTIMPESNVTADRRNHAAVYLPGPSALLVYAGSQVDASIPTTETFLISTQSPYTVLSYTAQNVPAVSPLLLLWNDTSAITLGGAADNSHIYHFETDVGWQDAAPQLPSPPKTSDLEQATLIAGSDGSRVLELYDLSVSPNNITEIILEDGQGNPAQEGQTIMRRSAKRRRALTIADWPIYNSTLAPTTTRQGYSLSRSPDGLVAITGGGDGTQPVALFNDQMNGWINTTQFFGASADQRPIAATTSSSSGTSGPTAAATSAAGGVTNDHPKTSLILGATLGSILGFIALLVIILLVVRYRRPKEQKKGAEGGEDEDDDEKDRMSFEDRGDPFMKQTTAPMYPAAHTSMSIHEGPWPGTTADPSRTHRRSETRSSEKSTTYLVPKKPDAFEMSTIPATITEASRPNSTLQVVGAAQPAPTRSSGWSRYFSGSDEQGDQGRRSASTTLAEAGSASMRTRTSSNHDCSTHGPTELPPLDMGQGFREVRINRPPGDDEMQQVQPVSRASLDDSRAFSMASASAAPSIWSQDGEEEQLTWTPVSRSGQWIQPGDTMRNTMASSDYGGSNGGSAHDRFSRYSASAGPVPRAVSGAHVLPRTVQEEDTESGVGRRAKIVSLRQPEHAVFSDLSWLNLGKK